MSDYIRREIEARNREWSEAKDILEAAEKQEDGLTAEQRNRLEALEKSIDGRKETIDMLTRMEESAKVGYEMRDIVAPAVQLDSTVTVNEAQQLSEAVRSIFQSRSGEIHLEFPTHATPPGYEQRALALFSDSSATVPVEFSSRVAYYQRTLSPIIGLATVINSTSGESMTLPRITADSTVYAPGEGTAITPSNPTFSAVTLTVDSYKVLTLVSQELAQDNAVNLMEWVARSAGRALGLYAGSIWTADILTDATNGGTASSAGTPFFNLDDLITLEYSMAAPYRQAGSWLMANGAISKARKFKDSDGQYLWQPAVQLGEPDILLGHPVYEDPYLATPASATKSVVFGDFSAYVIKQLPLRVAVSSEYLFNTDQVAIKLVYRAGAALPDAAAIRYLVSYTS